MEFFIFNEFDSVTGTDFDRVNFLRSFRELLIHVYREFEYYYLKNTH